MGAESRIVQASEIRWAPRLPRVPDTLGMSDEDLLVAALSEADAYRSMTQDVLRLLYGERRMHARLREAHHRLIDEYRRLRERTLRDVA